MSNCKEAIWIIFSILSCHSNLRLAKQLTAESVKDRNSRILKSTKIDFLSLNSLLQV